MRWTLPISAGLYHTAAGSIGESAQSSYVSYVRPPLCS